MDHDVASRPARVCPGHGGNGDDARRERITRARLVLNIREPDVCSRNENHDEKEKHHRKDDHQCRRSVRPRTILTVMVRCERRWDTTLETSAPRDRGPLSAGEGRNESWSYGLRSHGERA